MNFLLPIVEYLKLLCKKEKYDAIIYFFNTYWMSECLLDTRIWARCSVYVESKTNKDYVSLGDRQEASKPWLIVLSATRVKQGIGKLCSNRGSFISI